MSRFAQSFRDLEIWKLAIEVTKLTYSIVEALPPSEQYGIAAQMKRAAVSLPANIAEGFRRRHPKELKQFLHVVLGSAAELETYCELSRMLFNGEALDTANLLEQLDRLERMTNAMIGKLRVQK